MSEYEQHIGKLKRVDVSKYDSIERFFEEQYRKTFTDLTEQEIQDAYQYAANFKARGNSGPWEFLFQDNCDDYDIEYKYYVVNGMEELALGNVLKMN